MIAQSMTQANSAGSAIENDLTIRNELSLNKNYDFRFDKHAAKS